MARKSKINDETVIALRNRGMTHQEIADKIGVSRTAITRRVNDMDPELVDARTIEQYKQEKVDDLTRLEQKALVLIRTALDNIRAAGLSTKQIKDLMGIVIDLDRISRLERGKATEHITAEMFKELPEEQRDWYKELAKKRAISIIKGGKRDD